MTTKHWTAALTLCFIGGCGSPVDTTATQPAAAAGEVEHHRAVNPNPALYEKDARPFGRSMITWSEEWWRWAYSMPAASNPNATASASCEQNQDGPMFFIPNLFGSAAAPPPMTCTVPRHKAIGLSLESLLFDYPCPDPTFKPAAGQSLYNYLSTGAAKDQDVTQIDATLDGKPFKDLIDYHIVSDNLFYFSGDTSMQTFDSCITGTRQPAIADSYFIALKELEPGRHVLTVSVTTTSGAVYGPSTTTLDVR